MQLIIVGMGGFGGVQAMRGVTARALTGEACQGGRAPPVGSPDGLTAVPGAARTRRGSHPCPPAKALRPWNPTAVSAAATTRTLRPWTRTGVSSPATTRVFHPCTPTAVSAAASTTIPVLDPVRRGRRRTGPRGVPVSPSQRVSGTPADFNDNGVWEAA